MRKVTGSARGRYPERRPACVVLQPIVKPLTQQRLIVGWTPLHYAALHAPPTLVSYLATHGSSPFSKSVKGLIPLDIITGYDVIPGREGVALVLEGAMRASGWTGSARNHIRETRQREEAAKAIRRAQRRNEWTEIGRILGLADQWWEGRRPGEMHTPRIYLTAHDAEVAHEEEEEEAAGVANFEDLDEDEDDPTGDIINAILVSTGVGSKVWTYANSSLRPSRWSISWFIVPRIFLGYFMPSSTKPNLLFIHYTSELCQPMRCMGWSGLLRRTPMMNGLRSSLAVRPLELKKPSR
jgi:hypothetical protein